MQAFHESKSTGAVLGSYHQVVEQNLEPCCSFGYPHTQFTTQDFCTRETTLSFETCTEQFFTLDSSESESAHYASSISSSSFASTWNARTYRACSEISEGGRRNRSDRMIPMLDLKQGLIACAKSISDSDISTAVGLMNILEKMVSISGDPVQRLGAYLLEGLRARIESSGNSIYRTLRCEDPTGLELKSSMHVLYQMCPYWKFAYVSANTIIHEAVQNEQRIHIIDFQIAQGSQWIPFIESLSRRTGCVPSVKITGVDDFQSALARGGGLELIGLKLSMVAELCSVPFEFRGVSMSDHEVQAEHLIIQPEEAVVVNFPYVLHHVPDESVSIENHRDRLLRLVRVLSPKVVTLLEQESNTNTSPFYSRFLETLDYYSAMFESIDVVRPREDPQRIKAEQHCIARDIVNMVACEGPDRVERHELLGKWRSRCTMAGLQQCPLSHSVVRSVSDMLKEEYNSNYRIEEKDGALYLNWKNRAMVTCSAWR